MTVVLEDEVKVTLPADVALPDLSDPKAGLVADPRPPVTLTSIYYDTEDQRLHHAGITVRRRAKGRTVSWDVKVPVKRGVLGVRREVSVSDRSAEPPAAVTDLLRAWTGGEPLRALATLRTRRLTWTVRDGDGAEVAEVVDDEVAHVDGRTVLATFREVELERRGVAEAYVSRVLRRLAKAGGEPAVTTKLGRVVPVRLLPAPKVRRNGAVSALVTAALREGTADLLLADVGARLRQDDAVHQMRVSCRRLRSVLRAFGDVVEPAWRAEVDAELRWVGDALGAARDAEVLGERLARAADDLGAAAEPLLADVATRRAAADDAAFALLASDRYVAFTRRLLAESYAPPFLADAPDVPAQQVADTVVARAWRDVERAVRKARRKGAPDAAWHAVRIAAKRARYAAETAVPVAGKDAKRVAREGAAAQDALGVFHDTAGSVALLADLVADRPDDTAYGVVAGRLTERELRAGRAARDAFDTVWRRGTR